MGLAAVAQGMKQVEGADLAVELHGGRVRSVAGSRQVITADQISVPTNGVEHHAGIPRIGWQCRPLYARAGLGILICIKVRIFVVCEGLIASKLAPTGGVAVYTKPVGAGLLAMGAPPV
ncbi:hypothetical protein D9M73_243380 [compost metagenome]